MELWRGHTFHNITQLQATAQGGLDYSEHNASYTPSLPYESHNTQIEYRSLHNTTLTTTQL